MSSIKIEFAEDAPAKKGVKTYTGSPKKWPTGLYYSVRGGAYVLVERGWVAVISDDGEPGDTDHAWASEFVRISDNPSIASITFAGSMNYPDGRPATGSEVAS